MIYLINVTYYNKETKEILDLLKIGYTENMDKRLESYLTENPECKLLDVIDGNRDAESKLHKKFDKFRYPKRKEWFYYDEEIVNNFYLDDTISDKNNIIEVLKDYIKSSNYPPISIIKQRLDYLFKKYAITYDNFDLYTKYIMWVLSIYYDNENDIFLNFDFNSLNTDNKSIIYLAKEYYILTVKERLKHKYELDLELSNNIERSYFLEKFINNHEFSDKNMFKELCVNDNYSYFSSDAKVDDKFIECIKEIIIIQKRLFMERFNLVKYTELDSQFSSIQTDDYRLKFIYENNLSDLEIDYLLSYNYCPRISNCLLNSTKEELKLINYKIENLINYKDLLKRLEHFKRLEKFKINDILFSFNKSEFYNINLDKINKEETNTFFIIEELSNNKIETRNNYLNSLKQYKIVGYKIKPVCDFILNIEQEIKNITNENY